MNKIIITVIVVIIIVVVIFVLASRSGEEGDLTGEPIKIGVITPLTGGVAYWGESAVFGVELAKRDLATEGIEVDFIVEDGQLDPKVALNAAQKLVNMDAVDAVYSEFNPAAIAVTSFVKDKHILHLYDAAPISPLQESENIYKTYLDFEASCQEVAQLVKNRGIESVGVLKMNLEHGDLCLKGIRKVYGDNAVVEEYNPGLTDFRTPLSKLKTNDVQALFNVAFQPETLASLRNIQELKMDVLFVGLSEIVSPDIVDQYTNLLEGAVMFGLPAVSNDFIERLGREFPDATISNYQAVALAYMHLKQIAQSLHTCRKDLACVRNEMDQVRPEPLVGFTGFQNHIAGFDVLIQEWRNGEFVDIEQ